MATTIWFIDNGTLASQPLAALRWLDRDARLVAEPLSNTLPIAPVPRSREAIAVLLLPSDHQGIVVHNSVVVDAELLPLRHADCLEINGSPLWIAADFAAEETDYSLTRHDKEARCFITKARLRDGEPITICPGQPGKSCGMIYKRNAWRTAISAATRFRCPNCSFDPHTPVWRPTLPAPATTLDSILQMVQGEYRQ